ncbi:hypothetical protein BDN72DRAFT_858142 [Pluteus cervinus]|uniref:Uncharacterized protein n=1 Tax=Pluteus cervinus TaxID=181527 RepID=A0ACD3AT63_9AGAR|nr:hypothetical protein BDN72DRAFT_858142 [Pluteus cervinus]
MSSQANSLSRSSSTSSTSSEATVRPTRPQSSVDPDSDGNRTNSCEDSDTISKISLYFDSKSVRSLSLIDEEFEDVSEFPSDIHLILSTKVFPPTDCQFIETEDQFIICPAQIHVNLSEAIHSRWLSEGVSMPIIRVLGVTCVETEPCIAGYEFKVQYSTSAVNYSNHRDEGMKEKYPHLPSLAPSCMKPQRGVCIDLAWALKYLDSDTSSTEEDTDSKEASVSASGELVTGWFTNIWIPIPSWLFANETERTFKVTTEAWLCAESEIGMDGAVYLEGKEQCDKVYHETTMTAARLDYLP